MELRQATSITGTNHPTTTRPTVYTSVQPQQQSLLRYDQSDTIVLGFVLRWTSSALESIQIALLELAQQAQ
jgi:hypothetical protein